MRGVAATDGSVPVGRRLVQQSRGDLTCNLVFPGNSIQTWDTRTRIIALPSFWLSSCAHIVGFSCYAHKEFKKSCSTVMCTQNTRKHITLYRNSIQGEEHNLQQNPSNHKQGIQNTPPFHLNSSTHTLLRPWHDQRELTRRQFGKDNLNYR